MSRVEVSVTESYSINDGDIRISYSNGSASMSLNRGSYKSIYGLSLKDMKTIVKLLTLMINKLETK